MSWKIFLLLNNDSLKSIRLHFPEDQDFGTSLLLLSVESKSHDFFFFLYSFPENLIK